MLNACWIFSTPANLSVITKRSKNAITDIRKLSSVIDILSKRISLLPQERDHTLIGNYKDSRECHIEPDWPLIYRIEKNTLIL